MPSRSRSRVGRVLPIALCAVLVTVLAAAWAQSASAKTLVPAADSYVAARHLHHNLGRLPLLAVRRNPAMRAYLRFNTGSLKRVRRATLYLYSLRAARHGVRVRRAGDVRWNERAITWRHMPRVSRGYVRSGPLPANDWRAINVTRLLDGDKDVELALTGMGNDAVIVRSKEAGFTAPRLVLSYNPRTTTVPTAPRPAAPRPATGPAPGLPAPGLPPASPAPGPAGQTKTVMAVGDTCSSGGTPECTYVAQLIRNQHPDAFLHLGDLQYEDGNQSAFDAGYGRIFADLMGITYPVFGSTHDFGWQDYPVSYMNQHSAAKGKLSNGQWGYSFDIGAWHVVALNYNHPDPAALEADLQAHPSRCLMAFDHAPYLGTPSSQHGSNELSKSFVQPLFNHGLDLIINGHNHYYERLAPQTIDMKADPNGAAAFQVGTGGIGHYSFNSPAPNSVVRDASAFGALKLTLSPTGWTSEFIDAPGSSLKDTASGGCGA